MGEGSRGENAVNLHWNSLSDFLIMGRHGLYVRGTFVVVAAAMILEPALLVRSRKNLLKRLARQYHAEEIEADAVTRNGLATYRATPG
jgi:heme exporter protein D